MKYCTSLHFKTHSLLSKNKNRSVETTAAVNNGQKKKLVLKITRKMQTNKTGVNGADPAENQTTSYSAEVKLEGNEVNPWPYIHALLCSVAVFASGDRTSSL